MLFMTYMCRGVSVKNEGDMCKYCAGFYDVWLVVGGVVAEDM
jgi:hypothetical protein